MKIMFKGRLLLLSLFISSFFSFSAPYAWSYPMYRVLVKITPLKPPSYNGTQENFNKNPVYIEGEKAEFTVEFKRIVFSSYSYHIDIPQYFVKATFPNSRSFVRLGRISKGIYRYKSKALTRAGIKNHILTVRLKGLYYGGGSCSISVNKRVPEIDIQWPRDGGIVNRNRIFVYGKTNTSTVSVRVNGVFARRRYNYFWAYVPVSEGANIIRAVAYHYFGRTTADSVSITADFTPPLNPSVTFASGDYTNNRNIILDLHAEDAFYMKISESLYFSGTGWELYSETKNLVLSNGDGEKRVYAKFRDVAGNESVVVSDNLILDTTPPAINILEPEPDTVTSENEVNVNGIFIEENIREIAVNRMAAVIDGNSFSIEGLALGGEGNNTIEVLVTDLAGNFSTEYVSVVKDTVPPQNPSISVEGSEVTNSRTVIVRLSADNADEMIISENPEFADVSWELFSSYRDFVLSEESGTKKIYVKFRDIAGNESDIAACSIFYYEYSGERRIEVVERRLFVNGIQYIIKGVSYQPTPVGYTPEWGIWTRDIIYSPANCDRDFALLRDMGCNTIRTYGEVNQTLLDKAEEYGIMVCACFWVGYDLNFVDTETREELIENYAEYVNTYKNHPAVLMWGIGNEQNYQNGNNDAWYTLANEMAAAGREVEGSDYHPIALINGDLYNIGDVIPDALVENIDIWGANVYLGYSFTNNPEYYSYPDRTYFDDYAMKSSKPLWIAECGIDAWDNEHEEENQKRQAAWNRNNWDDIEKNGNICIGVTYMSYSDEWWKSGNVNSQGYGGYAGSVFPRAELTPFPDGFSNEEWWGIVAIEDNGSSPDIVKPRQIYYDLRKKWTDTEETLLVDDYEDGVHSENLFGGYSDIFFGSGGSCSYDNVSAEESKALYIEYDVSEPDSWAGYYTAVGSIDIRPYDVICFKVKVEGTDCNFKIGIRDTDYDEAKISTVHYLQDGITSEWQEVKIPLNSFGLNVDLEKIESINISLEHAIGSGAGAVWIDDLVFETDNVLSLIVDDFDHAELNGQSALFNHPWTDQSEDSFIDYEIREGSGYETPGGLCIEYLVAGGYCRWAQGLNGIDLSFYKNISFSVRGGDGDEEFYLYLQDRWGIRDYIKVDNIETEWTTVNLPVEAYLYKGIDITSIVNIEIVFQWQNTDTFKYVYFDDLRFEKN